MARRRNTSLLEDLLELTALLPWWAGVTLAIVSYGLLSAWTTQPLPTASTAQEASSLVTATLVRSLAIIGQYVLPVVFLIGACASAWRRFERRQLARQVARDRTPDALLSLSWQQFEKLVAEAFRSQGYRVKDTGGGGADGGIDIAMNRGSELFLVQCKRWRAQKVGVEVVRELYGVMAARGAAGGFVVCAGRYTSDAARFAQGRNIDLIDGETLRAWVRAARPREAATAAEAPTATTPPRKVDAHLPSAEPPAPRCPRCSQAMVRRTARQGANEGRSFWGCSTYPTCRGTRAT